MTEGPVLDGVMDEAMFAEANVVDTFVQQEPAEGQPATERTEVSVLYDGRRLYIGVRAFDSVPDGVIATEMRRDPARMLDEDNFQVIFDTFNDSRSGDMFVTNPLGAKLEQQIFEEGEGGRRRGTSSNVNRDWDGVWDIAARRTADGWTAEIAIPTVTLRFPDEARQSWGINFMRNIRRKNEQVFWAPIPKTYSLTRQPGREPHEPRVAQSRARSDGTRTHINLRLGIRVTSQLATEAECTRNDSNLPGGASSSIWVRCVSITPCHRV